MVSIQQKLADDDEDIHALLGSPQHKVRKQTMGELGETQTHTDLQIANAWSQTSYCYRNMPQMSSEEDWREMKQR